MWTCSLKDSCSTTSEGGYGLGPTVQHVLLMIRFSPLVTQITDPNDPSERSWTRAAVEGHVDELIILRSTTLEFHSLKLEVWHLSRMRPEAKKQRNDGLLFSFTSINFQVWGSRVSLNIIQCHHLRKQNPPIYILPILYSYSLRTNTIKSLLDLLNNHFADLINGVSKFP